ncbi:MAG: hypothetical protein WC438_02770 [Candidatus Pacearchaeota archaeon]
MTEQNKKPRELNYSTICKSLTSKAHDIEFEEARANAELYGPDFELTNRLEDYIENKPNLYENDNIREMDNTFSEARDHVLEDLLEAKMGHIKDTDDLVECLSKESSQLGVLNHEYKELTGDSNPDYMQYVTLLDGVLKEIERRGK